MPEVEQIAVARRVLDLVNQEHGSGLELVRRLPGGHQTGAYLVRDPGGMRAVLKWTADPNWARQIQRVAPVVERVRGVGWPTPKWLCAGITSTGNGYQIQEFVTGRPMDRLDRKHVRLLTELVGSQKGLDPDPGHDWSQYVPTVVYDGHGGAVDRVSEVGAEWRQMVSTLLILCEPHRRSALPGGDLVHGDLSTRNVLVRAGRIAGVIDVEAIGSGTRAIDLLGLVRSGFLRSGDPAAIAELQDAADRIARRWVSTVCHTAGLLELLHFVLRHNPNKLPDLLPGALRLTRWLSERIEP